MCTCHVNIENYGIEKIVKRKGVFNEISAESVTGKPTLTLLIRQFAVYNEEITGPPSFPLFFSLRSS